MKTTSKKVHLVLCDRPSPDKGGIENMGYWLARSLAQNGIHVVILAKEQYLTKSNFPENNISFQPIKNNIRLRGISLFYLAWHLYIIKKKFGTLINVHVLLINYMKLLRWIAPLLGWKCYAYLHGNEVTNKNNRSLKQLQKYINACEKLFAVSNYTASLLNNLDNNNKINIVHPGINPNFFQEMKDNTLYDKVHGSPKILMLSRLVERKGFYTVLSAVKRIQKYFPYIQVFIAGTGPARENIKRYAQSINLIDNVHFLGYISESQKPALFSLCDVYCMPSHNPNDIKDVEGFGITYLEASIMGTIPVGSYLGGIPEAIEDNKSGLLIHPGDDIELANKLYNLFSNPEFYNEMKSYAQRRAFNNFSWTQQVKKILTIMH